MDEYSNEIIRLAEVETMDSTIDKIETAQFFGI